MSKAALTRMPDSAERAAMDKQHVAQLLRSQAAQMEVLRAGCHPPPLHGYLPT